MKSLYSWLIASTLPAIAMAAAPPALDWPTTVPGQTVKLKHFVGAVSSLPADGRNWKDSTALWHIGEFAIPQLGHCDDVAVPPYNYQLDSRPVQFMGKDTFPPAQVCGATFTSFPSLVITRFAAVESQRTKDRNSFREEILATNTRVSAVESTLPTMIALHILNLEAQIKVLEDRLSRLESAQSQTPFPSSTRKTKTNEAAR